MSNAPALPLLVAVGDSAQGSGIVYAASEAAREGRSMRLVHVQPLTERLAERPQKRPDQQAGELLIGLAAEHARALTDGTVTVETFLRDGDVSDVLVDMSRGTDRVVLQRRQDRSADAVKTHSVLCSVAGRATVPVVSVPEFWNCSRPSRPRITIGVGAASGDFDLMRHAFEVAAADNAAVTVLHAWVLPTVWVTGDVELAAARRHSVQIRGLLEHRLETWRSRYPAVDVRLDVVNERPSDALIRASRSADLVLMGRPDLPDRAGEISSLSRAVLGGSDCPVEVVPARRPPARTASRGPTGIFVASGG